MNKEVLESRLKMLANDSLMVEAIKFVIEEEIEIYKPYILDETTDEMLGQKYRAYINAKDILRSAILKIESLKNTDANLNNFDKSK